VEFHFINRRYVFKECCIDYPISVTFSNLHHIIISKYLLLIFFSSMLNFSTSKKSVFQKDKKEKTLWKKKTALKTFNYDFNNLPKLYIILTVEKFQSWDLYDGFNVILSRWLDDRCTHQVWCKTEIKSAVHELWASYYRYRIQIAFYDEASGSNGEPATENCELKKNLQCFLRDSLKNCERRF
jgi:hypothetical protein